MLPSRALVLLLTVLALGAGCAPDSRGATQPVAAPPGGAGAPEASAPPEVRCAPVASVPWEKSVAATGEFAPKERVVVATKVPGRLAELRVDRGDPVARGVTVALLEAREYVLRVQQAEAAVAAARSVLGLPVTDEGDEVVPEDTSGVRLAEAELARARLDRERAVALAREGVDSQSVSDRAEADYRAAESRLQEARELVANRRALLAQRRAELGLARAQLEETEIVAPFAGQVVQRLSATGAYLATGAALVELVRNDPLRLVLDVGEREASAVRVGQLVRARISGREQELTGTVARLAPTLGDRSRALVIEAEFPNPDGALFAGAFAEARIVVEPEARALALPNAALVTFAGLDKVFVVRDGKVEERRVQVGRRTPELVELVSGVAEGDEVVLSPGKLSGGASVRVVP